MGLVCGVGLYEESDKYKCTINGKITKEYHLWSNMLYRCYSANYKTQNPTYKGCVVDKRFLKFQDFMSWCETQVGYKELDTELDKDLLRKHNKIYSPETCIFIPKEINMALVKRNASRGKYPIGVYYNKQYNKFVSKMRIGSGLLLPIGYSNTANEAFQLYKIEKEKYIKSLAHKYCNVLSLQAYNALMNYTVDIED